MAGEQSEQIETTVASERVYSGRVINLRVDTVALPGGRHYRREIVEHRGAVAIVALDEDGNVLMVRQFRKAAGKVLLELPAGTLEPGEDPLCCASRELQEETGFRAAQWQHLAGFYTSPGVSTEFLHLYLARDLAPSVAEHDADEYIELVKTPLPEAVLCIERGEICDGKTIVGLLLACKELGR